MTQINFNVDAGEGFDYEHLIFPWVSSCNISCGAHAGSNEGIKKTILLAKKHKLKIGAHPSYSDKENFGRESIELSEVEFIYSLKRQLSFFSSLLQIEKEPLHHVKAHGALYHDIHTNEKKASWFLESLDSLPEKPAIYGLPFSILEKLSEEKGYRFIREAFADRTYLDNGSLMPRKEKGSVLSEQGQVNNQVLNLISNHSVISASGKEIKLSPETICFHGDHKGVEERIKSVHLHLKEKGIEVR